MTYAMSMSSEVTTKTIRIKTVTNRNGPWVAGHDEQRGHDTNARAMKIAAQSVVAYLPIVRHVPLRPRPLGLGRGGY
jgi:hypothetical protein